MFILLMFIMSISSLFSYPKIRSNHQTGPDESEAACQTLKRFEKSLKSAMSREDVSLCMDSQPRAECYFATMEILKKCRHGIQVDDKCLQKDYEEKNLPDKACFCGGFFKFIEIITTVETLLCVEDQDRESRLIFPEFPFTAAPTTVSTSAPTTTPPPAKSALCTFSPTDGSGDIIGTVSISQSSASEAAVFSLDLSGLTPNMMHGFHIHQNGDLSDNCKATGGHYNPYNKNHGAPTSSERHVGDLGNIEADASGKVKMTLSDTQATLLGDVDITGRAIVIHEGQDDLGMGGMADSLTSGAAGGRMGCCIIK